MEQNEFLEEISKELSQIKTKEAYSCNRYNIFDVLGVGSKEVVVCRFLADLLSPNGKHGCGILFIKQFMNTLGSEFQNYSDELLQNTSVITEYHIDKERRIDIVIRSSKFFIPIEVKIYAGEQKNQCFDYYNFVKQNYGENTLIYLTRYGISPSEFSTGGDEETIKHIRCISFAKEIRDMLENCLTEIGDPLVKTTVEIFLDAIKKHSDPLWKEKNKVFEKIYKDKDSFRAAVEFEKHLNVLKEEKIRLINDLLSKLSGKISESCRSHFCGEIRIKKADGFYENSQLLPGFEYSIKQIEYNGKIFDICFRVEIEDNLYAGICIYNITNNSHDNHSREKYILEKGQNYPFLEAYIKNVKGENTFWAMWEYLPKGGKTENEIVPNFRNMNEAAIKLYDNNEMNKFVGNCVTVVKTFLENAVKWNELNNEGQH